MMSMRKLALLLILGILTVGVLAMSCGKPKPQPETTTQEPPPPPPTQTETTEVEPPPPPTSTLNESQFQTVYFDFDKFNLRTDARAALDHNYELLNEFPSATIKIEGHCDERGTIEYNLSLGEKRAKSCMDYLTGLGIAPGRISTISYGKERPIDPGHNESAWSKNRRGEFRITSQ
jgi:peptidoglycan-associated lipoprotein